MKATKYGIYSVQSLEMQFQLYCLCGRGWGGWGGVGRDIKLASN